MATIDLVTYATLTVLALCCLECSRAMATPVMQYDTGLSRVLCCELDQRNTYDQDYVPTCSHSSYKGVLVAWAFPGLLCAAAMAIFTIAFFCGRYMCNCCGGRKQRPNFCFPNDTLPAKYSRSDLTRPLVLAVACFVMALSACVWGCSAARTLSGSLQGMKVSSLAMYWVLRRSTEAAIDQLMSANYFSSNANGDVSGPLVPLEYQDALRDAFEATANEVYRMPEETIWSLYSFNQKFLWTIYLFFPLITLGSACALVAGFCNCRHRLPMVLVAFFGGMGVVVWALQGLLAANHVLVQQMCSEVTDYTGRSENAVMAATACNETLVHALTPAFDAAVSEAWRLVCEGLVTHCYLSTSSALDNVQAQRVFNCPVGMLDTEAAADASQCASVSAAHMRSWMMTSFDTDQRVLLDAEAHAIASAAGYICRETSSSSNNIHSSCSLAKCAMACTEGGGNDDYYDTEKLSMVGRVAREAISRSTALQHAENGYSTGGIAIASCDTVLTTVVPPLLGPCKQAVAAAWGVHQSSGLMGLALIVGMFACILGAKRFIPFSQVLIAQYG